MIEELNYLITLPISFFAGLTQGLTGFGSALVAMPFFIQILPAKLAVSLSILNGLLITTILTIRHRSDIKSGNILPLIIGSVPGILLGINFLRYADEILIKRILGAIIILYSIYSLSRKRTLNKRLSRIWGIVAGFLTGIIGASFSAGGPPTIIYVTLSGWKKDEIKGTLSAFFLFTGIFISTGHLFTGISNKTTYFLFLLNAPFILSGVFLGMKAYRAIPYATYLKLVLILLLAMGCLLLFF